MSDDEVNDAKEGLADSGVAAQGPAQEVAQPENRRARRAAASSSRKKGQKPGIAPRPGSVETLNAGERVDDAFTRAADGFAGFIKDHFNIVQWLVVASVAGWIGYQIYSWRADRTAAKVGSELADAMDAESGRIGSPDDEDKRDSRGSLDARRVFTTDADRLKTAADSYQKVATESAGKPAAGFAKLGLAGVLYDQSKYDDARKMYEEVSTSDVAKVSPEMKGRSLEGIGLSLEAKGDKDGALKAYTALENAEVPGFRELALYDEARLLHEKGDEDGAKSRLKKVVDKLAKEAPPENPMAALNPMGPQSGENPSYLADASKALLMRIDPKAVPPPTGDEAIRKALEEFQKKMPAGVVPMQRPLPAAP